MTDTTTVWDVARSRGDWVLSGVQLQTGNDLASAALISLFTDRIADVDDKAPEVRGWCLDDPQRPIGSRLWLLERAKETTETLNRARDFIVEALQWLIDDGVVAKFEITVEWTRPRMLGALIIANKPDGTRQKLRFDWAWST